MCTPPRSTSAALHCIHRLAWHFHPPHLILNTLSAPAPSTSAQSALAIAMAMVMTTMPVAWPWSIAACGMWHVAINKGWRRNRYCPRGRVNDFEFVYPCGWGDAGAGAGTQRELRREKEDGRWREKGGKKSRRENWRKRVTKTGAGRGRETAKKGQKKKGREREEEREREAGWGKEGGGWICWKEHLPHLRTWYPDIQSPRNPAIHPYPSIHSPIRSSIYHFNNTPQQSTQLNPTST